MQRRIAMWTIFGLVWFAANSHAEEWPKWLGPKGDGISTDVIATRWPADGPKKLWSQNVGQGFSSVVGLDDKVYVLGMQGSNDVLTALDASSGKVLWSESYPITHKADQPQAQNLENHLPVPEASPTIDGDRIYTYGGGGDLICRTLADGKAVWKLNVLDETGATILAWNCSSSPLVTDKFVYVQVGKDGPVAVAVDKMTGKIAWKAVKAPSGYAAPIFADVAGSKQLIIFAGKALYGLDPQTGKTLWSTPWPTLYQVNAVTPIYKDGYLFISSDYGHGCAMFKLSATGATLDWKGKQLSSKFQPCILDSGTLFGSNGGRLTALQWPTNNVLWSADTVDLNDGGSFIIDGQQAIALSEKGQLSLVGLGAAGPTVKTEVSLFDYDKVWSFPVIYHGKLYAKGKTELVCLDLGHD